MALAILSLFALLAVSNAVGPLNLDPRIVNGEPVKAGEIPYQVSLQTNKRHFCGGSVLNANYVLTAAHCVFAQNPSTIEVVAGTTDLNSHGSVHQAVKIIVHSSYSPKDSWRNDIALIKVKTPFVKGPQTSFVALPQPNQVIAPNSAAVVSGWGRTSSSGPTTTKLLKARIYIVDQTSCKNVYQRVPMNIYDTHICANDPKVEKGSCNGDSGGPLTVNGKIVGLVSWAMDCALTNYPTVYTRVTSYLDWIKQNAV